MTHGGKNGEVKMWATLKLVRACLGMGLEANQNWSLFPGIFALHVSDSKLIVEVKCLWHFGRITPICSVSAAASSNIETLFLSSASESKQEAGQEPQFEAFDEIATHVTPAGHSIFFLFFSFFLICHCV